MRARSPRILLAKGDELAVSQVGWSPDGGELLGPASGADGYALVSVPLDGSPTEVRTPWTCALNWIALEDVSWSSR
jgi:hypothetical protein